MGETNESLSIKPPLKARDFWILLDRRLRYIGYCHEMDPTLQSDVAYTSAIEALIDALDAPPEIMSPDGKEFFANQRAVLVDGLSTLITLRHEDDDVQSGTKKIETVNLMQSAVVNLEKRTKRALTILRSHGTSSSDGSESLSIQVNELLSANRELQERLSAVSEARLEAEEQLRRLIQIHAREKEQLEKQLTARFQETIEEKTTQFVDKALTALEASKKEFHSESVSWSRMANFCTLAGVALSAYFAIEGTKQLIANSSLQWALLTFFAVKGGIMLGLIYAAVSYCAKQGRSYMHESLKSAERIHAINYGKFYLSAFGAGSGDEKVKEAFAHWNITSTSAFLTERDEHNSIQKFATDAPVSILEKLIERIPKS